MEHKDSRFLKYNFLELKKFGLILTLLYINIINIYSKQKKDHGSLG